MAALISRMVCAGCGWQAPAESPLPIRCPEAGSGDDVDHVLRRVLEPGAPGPAEDVRRIFEDDEPLPFLRYRKLLHSHLVATAAGLPDEAWVDLARHLDSAVARVVGHGFVETPLVSADALARRIGLARGGLRVKDETGNVAGSHKARHMMGLQIALETARRLGLPGGDPDLTLAVASCGNAALAAVVLARAAERDLAIFVPPDAEAGVIDELARHGAVLTACPRLPDEVGDPCIHRFREAVAAGALPFTCQGNENGLVIEGCQTLAWEIVSTLRREGAELDHLVVQVGGGALASACIRALREARDLGVLARLPRIHTVQTEGAWPLRRAWDRVVRRLVPEADLDDRPALARALAGSSNGRVAAEIRYAATHRSEFMRPWDTEPRSVARGILDDETYDWLLVVEGMLQTGGVPLVVSEEALYDAWDLGREATGIPVEPTGTAGLAGCLELVRAGEIAFGETVALLFTGVER